MPVLHDARGKSFEADPAPSRIVSLVPSWTETLFAFHAGDRIAAITDYCIHPASDVAGKSRIGGTKNPRLDEIIALNPDLVIANEEENRRDDVEQLEQRGIPVFVTSARTVREALSEMETLGLLIRAPNLDALIRPIRSTYQRLLSIPRARPARVAVLIWRDPWMTANGETYISNLLETCGGINEFGTRRRRFPLAADLGFAPAREIDESRDTRYPRLSLEEIAEVHPDLLLLPTEPYPFTQLDARALAEARVADRVCLVDGTLASWYGVRMGRAMEYFSDLLSESKVETYHAGN